MTPTGRAVDLLDIARSQLGVRESGGGNRQRYSTETDLPITEWCAIFVSWCLSKAAVPGAYRSTRVTLFARHYASLGRFNRTPTAGSLVCFDWGMDGQLDHMGIVESVRPDGRLVTIEGNTNPGGGQVDGVWRMLRSPANARGYCHPAYRPIVLADPVTIRATSRVSARPGSPLVNAARPAGNARTVRAAHCPVLTLGATDNGTDGWVRYAEAKLGVPPNGYYGPEAAAAVKRLQSRKGYPVTGRLAAAEWNSLGQPL